MSARAYQVRFTHRKHNRIIVLLLPQSPVTVCPSRLVTEGCLISVSRRGAGSGGRDGSVGDAAQISHPAVQAALFPACLPHAEAPLTADRLADGQKIASQMARASYGGFRRGDA